MRKLTCAFILLLLAGSVAYPCGGKYLALVQVRYARCGVGPASILIFNNPKSIDDDLQFILKEIGHKVKIVGDLDEFANASKSGKYDIIMADISDIDALKTQFQSELSDTMLVYVMHKPSKADVNDVNKAENQYRYLLLTPCKFKDAFNVIDKAFKSAKKSAKK